MEAMGIETGYSIPEGGWVRSIRRALGMSFRQLGERLGITPQSAKEIEMREAQGTVSLNIMRQTAEAMGVRFVYGFLLPNGEIEGMVRRRAEELAREIVTRTLGAEGDSGNQGDFAEARRELVDELARRIAEQRPRYLWDFRPGPVKE